MKVYLTVVSVEYEGDFVEKVFDTHEKALDYARVMAEEHAARWFDVTHEEKPTFIDNKYVVLDYSFKVRTCDVE